MLNISSQLYLSNTTQDLSQRDEDGLKGPDHAQNSAVSQTDDLARVHSEPGQQTNRPDGSQKDSLELSAEAEEIRQLQLRDHEVRAHEAAHAASGGAYAGSPQYQYQQGPDGKTYATDGEVSIDMSPVSGDPEATLDKAEQIRAAALAPAQPSGQDLKVAQKAQSMANKAKLELTQQQAEELSAAANQDMTSTPLAPDSRSFGNDSSPTALNGFAGTARLSIYS